MFITSNKFNKETAKLRSEIGELRLILKAAIGEKQYIKATKNVDATIDGGGLSGMNLEYEELSNPLLDENKLPPRSEYNDRLDVAIKLFMENHPVSEVATKLSVARKTARRYLRIAIEKRKVKKGDYDKLNK